MASRPFRRTAWHRDKTGRWSLSLGERGQRVRLFQKRKDGPFYRAVWIPERGRDIRPLGTKDREEAERLGKLLFAELLRNGGARVERAPLTIGELWKRYSAQCAEYLDNKDRTRRDAGARAAVLIGYFGDDFEVHELTIDHQRRYERARAEGGIITSAGLETGGTRARSAEADVALLHAMLRWATTVRLPGGGYLLDRHPLLHVRRTREKNKKQPPATWERYQATLAACQKLRDQAASEPERARWVKIEVALFIAEATGRRLGSIRQLRWEDVLFDSGVVQWRAEADKKGYAWEVPMPASFFEEIRRYQRELGAIGGPVFAAPGARDGIMDRHLFDKWLTVAEKTAGLPKLDGGLWHPYRRKWAMERKHLPLRDVAAAGGWKDVTTLLEVYQQADAESVLAVTSEPRKLRERVAVGAGI